MSGQFFRTNAVLPGSAVPLLARLLDTSGSNATQATYSGITLDVYDTDDPDNPVVSALAITVNTAVYNTLQTDSRWGPNAPDSTGYNFAYVTLPAHTPRSDAVYMFVFTCTQTDGKTVLFRFAVPTKNPATAD